MNAPFIVGKNIYLRALEISDVERCKKWINDPEVTRTLFMGRFPMNNLREQEWLNEKYKSNKELTLAMCLKEGDRHIGNCGFNTIDFVDRWASLGILIGESEYWNQGYGTEAMKLVVDHGFGALNLNRLELSCFSFNERALACYKKAGFVEEGRLRQKYFKNGQYCDDIILAQLRSDWEKERSSAK